MRTPQDQLREEKEVDAFLEAYAKLVKEHKYTIFHTPEGIVAVPVAAEDMPRTLRDITHDAFNRTFGII